MMLICVFIRKEMASRCSLLYLHLGDGSKCEVPKNEQCFDDSSYQLGKTVGGT